MDLKAIEKVVGSLQSQLFRNSNSISIGMLKSHFKGSGLQFKEHQIYAPGDDVRFIDWKLTAKTNTPMVKTFEEERNVEIYCFLDITPTMMMGYKNTSKLQAAIEVICLLFLLAEKTKDMISVIISFAGIQRLPLQSGQKGITLFISQLEKKGIMLENGKINISLEFPKETKEEIEDFEKKKLAVMKALIAKKKELVLLSDFSSISDMETIAKLIYRPNMHCFKVMSPIDEADKLPFSIFGRGNNKKGLMKTNSKLKERLNRGRYKTLKVEERYLENFVREML